jgi:hypothetical protein
MLASTRSSRVPSPVLAPSSRSLRLPCSLRRPVPEQTIRAARASDRRKRRSIWRERPPERNGRRRGAVGTMRWMHSAMHYSASIVVDGFHCDPEHVKHWMQLLYVNATVSQNGNVEGNNPRILLQEK